MNVTGYRWKSGSRMPSQFDANLVAEQFQSLRERTPRALVDANRDESAPLHGYFEWDDTVAGERYREHQASYVIRHIAIVYERGGEEQTTSAFQSIPLTTEDGEGDEVKRRYLTTIDAMADPVTRARLLARAKSELESWRRKYRDLNELAGVFAAIDTMREDVPQFAVPLTITPTSEPRPEVTA